MELVCVAIIAFFLIRKFMEWESGGKRTTQQHGANEFASTAPVQPESEPSAAERTGIFFRGSDYYEGLSSMGKVAFSYRDGYVYKDVNYGTDLFNSYEYTYSGGTVYNRAGTRVGSYRNGYVWLGTDDAWIQDAAASYGNGYVYPGNYKPELFTGSAIGRYKGDDDGAAACAIAMLLEL